MRRRVGTALLLAVAAAGGSGAQSKHGTSHQHGTQTVLVTLDTTLNGVTVPCQIANQPADFGGRKNMKITWQITNNCGGAMYVRVQDFHPYNDDGSLQGTETNVMNNAAGNPNTDPSTTSSVPAGGFQGLLGTVAKTHGGGRQDPDIEYKYTICIGPNANPSPSDASARCLDPDGDVWP